MPTFNQDQASTAVGYGGFLAPAAAGVGAGVIGTAAYATVSQAASDAKLGKWLALGIAGLQVFSGNAALNNANNAMAQVNTVVAGGSYAQADMVALKGAVQQLAQGLQNNTPGGYTGVSNTTNATTTPSVATTQTTSSNGALLIAGLALAYIVAKS